MRLMLALARLFCRLLCSSPRRISLCAAIAASIVVVAPGLAHAEERLTITLNDASGPPPEAACLFDSGDLELGRQEADTLALVAEGESTESGFKLWCACNSLSRASCKVGQSGGRFEPGFVPKHVLFFQVFSNPSRGAPKRVYLDGAQLHVIATWSFHEPAAWVVSTRRSYAPGSAAVTQREKVLGSFAELRLTPFLVRRTFLLPEVDRTYSNLTATLNYWTEEQPVSPIRRRRRQPLQQRARLVSISIKAGGQVSEKLPFNVTDVDIEVHQPGTRDGDAARYVARLPDANVTDPIPVRARRITFRWQPQDCIYVPHERDDCPRARVVSSGDPCTSSFDAVHGVCNYDCTAAGTFEVPTEVRMGVGPQDDAWTEKIVRVNQRVAGAPSRETRQLEVTLPWEHPERWTLWRSKPRTQELVHVDLFAPDRRAFRIDVDKEPRRIARTRFGDEASKANPARVTIPGVTCNDRLTYQYWGRYQNFEPNAAPLEKGRYVLHPPSQSFLRWWLSGRLSLGWMWSLGKKDVSRTLPTGEIEAALQRRFYDKRYIVEGAVTYVIGARDYVPINADPSDGTHALVMNRLFAGLRVMGGIYEDLWIGGAGGIMITWPVSDRRGPLVGNQTAAFYHDLVLRYVPSRSFNIQISGRVVFPEDMRTFTADKASSATYTTEHRIGFVGPIIGLGFWLPP